MPGAPRCRCLGGRWLHSSQYVFVERRGHQGLSAGLRLFALATRATETHLAHTSAPFLRKVVAGLNETTHLCVLRGNKVLTLHSELASHAFRGIGWEGTSVDPYTTSAGRTLLSAWDTETITGWWDHFPHQATPTSAPSAIRDNVADWPLPPRVTLAGLLDHVDAIRRHGYASVDEEFEPGLVGVSAPVSVETSSPPSTSRPPSNGWAPTSTRRASSPGRSPTRCPPRWVRPDGARERPMG